MGKVGLYYPSGCCQADLFMLFWKKITNGGIAMTTKKRICTVIIVLVIVCAVCVGGFFVWKKTGKGGSKSSQKVYVQKVSSLNTANCAIRAAKSICLAEKTSIIVLAINAVIF